MFRQKWLILTAVVVLIGGLFTAWMAQRTDRQLRAELLHQTKLIAQAINIDHVKALTGTETDLDVPEYLRLKEQFAKRG